MRKILSAVVKNKNQLSENVERIKSAWNTLSASLSEIQNSIKSDSDDLTEKQIADLKKSCDAYFMALSDKKESSAEKQKNDISTLVVSVSNIQKKLQQAENSQRELQKKQSEFTEITDKLNNLLTSLYPLINESVNNFTVNITPLTEYQKIMRGSCNVLYNHKSIDHKQFVKDTIALVPDGGNYKDLPPGVGESRIFHMAWTRYCSYKPSRTIDTGHRNNFHYKWNRCPTVRESARLQSFPDDFVFLGNKGQQDKQVGNAVPCLMAKAIGVQLLKYLE